jgi:AMP phosphorylase
MKLKVIPIHLEVGGKPIIILNEADAESLGLHSLDRVLIKFNKKNIISIVDITSKFAKKGEAVTNEVVTSSLDLKQGDTIDINPQPEPESVIYIKEKVGGARLELEKIRRIVQDVVDKKISDIELSAFVTALYTEGISMDEAENLSKAMVETGKQIKFKSEMICDKHSIGGIPGDKTSMVLVPLVAAAGLTIPKTSSRSITSPAGTADRMEVLAEVDLKVEEIIDVVKKTNACLVWGGSLDLAPADDAFIKIEYPLGIDPLLLPSIMSKKKAIGAHYVVIDIPMGRGAKIENEFEANSTADDFIELGKKLNIQVACGITFGSQPLGHCVGPALEAREALIALKELKPRDLVEKVISLAGILFEMVGTGNKQTALSILKSGKAEKKFREIIEAQGGDPKVKPNDIKIGDKYEKIKSSNDGHVLWIDNLDIAAIAKAAGAPQDKGAGIQLNAKMGDIVKKGQELFTIYSENSIRLNRAINLAKKMQPLIIGKKFEEKMLLDKIYVEVPHRRTFLLER